MRATSRVRGTFICATRAPSPARFARDLSPRSGERKANQCRLKNCTARSCFCAAVRLPAPSPRVRGDVGEARPAKIRLVLHHAGAAEKNDAKKSRACAPIVSYVGLHVSVVFGTPAILRAVVSEIQKRTAKLLRRDARAGLRASSECPLFLAAFLTRVHYPNLSLIC
jgi:hypothetical protein